MSLFSDQSEWCPEAIDRDANVIDYAGALVQLGPAR